MNPKRILLVDDNDNLRAIIKDILSSKKDLSVVDAADGLSALKEIRLNPPDAVILDHQMPRMSGLAALKKIKKINPRIPVIFMTGESVNDNAFSAKILAAGAFVILPKPLDIQLLIKTVKTAIDGS